ncbi:MAG: hypothetical protein ABR598_07890, partial [Candidatus Dormibacteria bacterium]
YHLASTLRTTYPAALEVEIQWRLDATLVTRLLYVHSVDAWDDEYELEATVTGNGMLAHRVAPDGPTQIELGWGPNAEFDFLSAAFAVVMMARSFDGGAQERAVDAVELGVEDLVPVVIGRRYELLSGDRAEGFRARCTTPVTGHATTIEVAPSGALLGYAGLLALDGLVSPTK